MLIVFVTDTSIEHHRACADDVRVSRAKGNVLIVWLTTSLTTPQWTRKRGRFEGIFRTPFGLAYCSPQPPNNDVTRDEIRFRGHPAGRNV